MVSNAFHRPNRPIQGSVSLYGNTYGVHLVVACDILMKCAQHYHGNHTGQKQDNHQGVHDTVESIKGTTTA